MLKVYKKFIKSTNNYEVRILNEEDNTFTFYFQDANLGFTFSHYTKNINKMGYKSMDDCIKSLKYREMLGEEINHKEQIQSEIQGWINLGIDRIKRHNRINTLDFEDVIQKLEAYGINYCDAQDRITNQYLNLKEV